MDIFVHPLIVFSHQDYPSVTFPGLPGRITVKVGHFIMSSQAWAEAYKPSLENGPQGLTLKSTGLGGSS